MSWPESIDVAVFRFVNDTLSNPLLDRVMPFLSHNRLFVPVLVAALALLLWRGGRRGRICVVLLILVLLLGEGLITNPLKHLWARSRPFLTLADVHVLVGKGESGSLPSAHAANWFAATMVLLVYYRRSVWIMLPLAALVSVSRVYNGVHYPADVLVGGVLGAGYAVGILGLLNLAWQQVGRRWFEPWWRHLPSLLRPDERAPSAAAAPQESSTAATGVLWLRLGYVVVAILLLGRLFYIGSGIIQLSEDEAYQWHWSKKLALSYYSKPPMIAYTQFVGTAIWGDNALGIRFFSPVIAAVLSVMLLRFLAREADPRVGFWLTLVSTATPLLAVGSTLMTIDPLSVLFWAAAMVSGWRAVQQDSTRHWLCTGLWAGLGFLSKYTALFQWLCWAVFFCLWPPARRQLRRPGPYLALLVNAACALPVLIWNAQHQWVTVTHLGERAGLDSQWVPTLRFFGDFVGSEIGLLNPVFCVAMVWACVGVWKRERADALLMYLLSMGAPLFLFYLLYTFRARVHPNWIAPSVVPLFCLMTVYWFRQWRAGVAQVPRWLAAGLTFGTIIVVVLHDTNLIGKLAGRPLPVALDPLRRVRGWSDSATVAGEARNRLLREGRPVFILGDHYGITAMISFYLPEAKAGVPASPLVYCRRSSSVENQFHLWPGYQDRRGQNVIFVIDADKPKQAPPEILEDFESVTDLGLQPVTYRGRVLRKLQIFECRGKR